MPSPIKMSLTNGNLAQVQFEALTRSRLAAVPVPKKNAALKAPMIGRIHNVRPGCGSCNIHFSRGFPRDPVSPLQQIWTNLFQRLGGAKSTVDLDQPLEKVGWI